ncbi:hypothetical protein ACFL6C_06815 [Myxococcota bacterium]
MVQYKYSKQVGALQEAMAESQPSTTRRSRVMVSQQVDSSRDKDALAEADSDALAITGSRAIPVGRPHLHAQTVLASHGQPHPHRGHGESLAPPPPTNDGRDPVTSLAGASMFFYTVDEGQHVLIVYRDGTMEEVAGPRRVWRIGRKLHRMGHFVAHPGEFLIVRLRNGGQEHLPGPADIWQDQRKHVSIAKEEALQIASKEAVVAYSKAEDGAVRRRIVHGPATFVPEPGEWLHTFSWHGSSGDPDGYRKVPNGLVFQKLWLMPDQMYHDVTDVRTADDAVLTIRLMIFFELIDIEKMLDTTHDPIGDFVNAAASDVVDLIGRHDFESFKRNTDQLNELATYKQLDGRAEQCGYRINKVVYRGYGLPASLQEMHDQAIESRTRLQLERATETQAQELEDYKLDRHLARADKQREERNADLDTEIQLNRKRRKQELEAARAEREFARTQLSADTELDQQITQTKNDALRKHFAALEKLGVDLTRYLTQARADQVIELRSDGTEATHLHLPGTQPEAQEKRRR